MKILFVCTGNTCRSPMAEAIFNYLAQKHKNFPFKAISRGLSVYVEESINPKADEALKSLGIMNTKHISRQISSDDIKTSELVLTMTQMQKETLQSYFKESKYKIATLLEYAADSKTDISDPFGKSQVVYNFCAKDLKDNITELINRLKEDYEIE